MILELKLRYLEITLWEITMKLDFIDNGKEFDFGRTSNDYAKFRGIYPKNTILTL